MSEATGRSNGERISRQIVLPWGKSLSMAVNSLRIRFFRALVTTFSLVLAIAFLGFTLTGSAIARELFRLHGEAALPLLTSAGYAVDVARTGREAIAFVAKTVPDGIVLDLMMPEVDGFEVLEEIRNRPETATLPVLILTAKDLGAEDFKRLSANNVQQLVQKGDVDQASLLRQVGSMLESIHARKPGSVQDQAGSEGLFAGQPVIPAASSGQPTVLVVEDNADNMVTMEAILGNRFRIIPAVNGEDGLRLAAEFRPDLILLDMALPGLDGMAVAARLKADPGLRHIPVIALTAQAMKGDRERILAAGCEDYLSKPIDPERLLRVIDKRFKG